MKFLDQLQALDRRYIYIVVALAIIIPLLVPYNSDVITTPPTENLYQLIDSYSGRSDRAILISFYHDASTMPELYPMELAILRHCFERKIKVFTLTFIPAGAPIIDFALNTVKEEYPNIQSGVDYCNFGYKIMPMIVALGMGDNIATTIDTDAEGRKLANLPIMKNIVNYNEMNLIIETSGSVAGGTWITYARSKFGANVAVGVTAVMAADEYPYLQSGQLIGMLTGLKGAAEYEKLVDVFAAYRDDNFPQGRPFSKEILRDPSIKKLINITTQTQAVFSPEEYKSFVAKYPQQAPYLDKLKQQKDGNIVFDVTKITPADQKLLGPQLYTALNKQTHNILYKFKTARIGMNAQSIAHIMILVFIVIGNIGYFTSRTKNKKA
ncbi:MAG TPA: hypothetical protein PLF50_02680 [Candidatus Cloacimonadota bacterium]|nr:hypothetical protein [Candidatus Cloacimonadota bacterium]HOV16388.1 hypothetical protein [Candidatus Cloacimonadota bacterium]HQL15289.1 hypothetical protein [Candidatus Cloacimonadota bacterium]